MLDEWACLAVSDSSQQCWGQDSVQVSQVLPHQTRSFKSLWTLLCALVLSRVGTGRGHPHCFHKVGSMKLSKISWYAEAFRVPFTGTKGPSPAPEKQLHTIIPPPPNFTLGTMNSDKYRSPGNHQTQTHPSDCQMEKRDSSLQRTRLHCSRVQWRRALHHCIRRFALHLVHVWFGCSCSATETHSMKLSTRCSWANLKATWSLEVCSLWLYRKLATSTHYAPQDPSPRSVIIRGLPLCGWVAVIPNRFHFVIIPLTVDCGIFNSKEISRQVEFTELLRATHFFHKCL